MDLDQKIYGTILSKAWLNCGQILTKFKIWFWFFGRLGEKTNYGRHPLGVVNVFYEFLQMQTRS